MLDLARMPWSKLLWTLIKPGNLLLLLLLGICLLSKPSRARPTKTLLFSLSILLVAVTVLPLPQLAIQLLEQRFPPTSPEENHYDGVIVLGGSENAPLSQEYGQPSLDQSSERILEFIHAARICRDCRLVTTGGSGLLNPGRLSETDVDRMVFEAVGFDSARVVFENNARNTHENAVFSAALVAPRPEETWLLITSAWHMPRAVGVFRQAGWNVLPCPVDYLLPRRLGLLGGFDLLGAMQLLTVAGHEWLGLASYRLRGYTNEFFPGP